MSEHEKKPEKEKMAFDVPFNFNPFSEEMEAEILNEAVEEYQANGPPSVKEMWDEFRDKGLNLDEGDLELITVRQAKLVIKEVKKAFYGGVISGLSTVSLAIKAGEQSGDAKKTADEVTKLFQDLADEVKNFATEEFLASSLSDITKMAEGKSGHVCGMHGVHGAVPEGLKVAAEKALEKLKELSKKATAGLTKKKASSSIMDDLREISGWPKQTPSAKDPEFRDYDIPVHVDTDVFVATAIADVSAEDKALLTGGVIPERLRNVWRESLEAALKTVVFKNPHGNFLGAEPKKDCPDPDRYVCYVRGENAPWIEFSFSKLVDDIMHNTVVSVKRVLKQQGPSL